jgi:hypothetical protein
MFLFRTTLLCVLSIVQLSVVGAGDLTQTRPEMKKRIEALKQRQSRLPLPPPTDEEIASGKTLVNNPLSFPVGAVRPIGQKAGRRPF